MGGILKNRLDHDQQDTHIAESTKEFREQVLKNTKLNALLKSDRQLEDNGSSDSKNSTGVSSSGDEKLQWNKQNLSENEIIQKNIMENLGQTIDEPKTPFQKATQPELNEYYQDDDDENNDLENFSLGEPEFGQDELDQLDNTDRDAVIPSVATQQGESRKKSFEELRKQHYHNEHIPVVNPLSHKVHVDEAYDAEDDDEDQEEVNHKKSFAELRKQHYHLEHVPKPSPQTFDDEDEDEEDEE